MDEKSRLASHAVSANITEYIQGKVEKLMDGEARWGVAWELPYKATQTLEDSLHFPYFHNNYFWGWQNKWKSIKKSITVLTIWVICDGEDGRRLSEEGKRGSTPNAAGPLEEPVPSS